MAAAHTLILTHLALLLVAGPAFALSPPERARIDALVAEARQQRERLPEARAVAQRPDVAYPSELSTWADAAGLRLIEITERDDSGDVRSEYLYASGSLLFARQVVMGYDAAGQAVERMAQRAYFRDGAMAGWFDGETDEIDPASADFAAEDALRRRLADFFLAAAGQAETPASPTAAAPGGYPGVGVVSSLEAGDVACHLQLKDDQGRSHELLAEFEICAQKATLLGRRVHLDYATGTVAADACQGDPTCTLTRPATWVAAARLAPAEPPAGITSAARASHQASFCERGEEVVFSCRSGRKQVSVCASADAAPGAGYLEYRFGLARPGAPLELRLPARRSPPERSALGGSMPFSGGGGSWLRFRAPPFAYVVYSGIGRWGAAGELQDKAGLVVERHGQAITTLACDATPQGVLGPDWLDRLKLRSEDEYFEFPD